jgi:SWI/SNF-related matrix-associated actin-dependent regulator of chromatin subfamily A-like protein 1
MKDLILKAVPNGKTLYPFQVETVEKTLQFLSTSDTHSAYVASEMGCLSGDTVLKVSRAKASREMTIKQLFHKFHGGKSSKGKSWNTQDFNTSLRAFNGTLIQLHTVKDVIFSGIREVYLIELVNGKTLKATADHKILTQSYGFVAVDKLTSKHLVATDTITRYQKRDKPKPQIKPRYNMISVGAFHPFARVHLIKHQIKYKVDVHRLVYEAHENNLSLERFVSYTYNAEKSKTLKFVDPKHYCIHHHDHNTKNNLITNLRKLTVYEHQALHGGYEKFGHGKVSYSAIRAISFIGREETFDIVMEEPYRNFVANGIVVHNCGKSVTSIITAKCLSAARVLIISPAIMRLVWARELRDWWNRDLRMHVMLSGKDVEEYAVVNATAVICSYSLLANKEVLKCLGEQRFDMLILDEAHSVKNARAIRTKAIMGKAGLWENAKYRLLLSGTPMLRNVTDLYVPFSKLAPRNFPSWNYFVNNYSHSRRVPWGAGVEYYGLKNADTLSSIIRNNFYIRYKKADVLTELPPKVYSRITLPDSYSVKHMSDSKARELWEEMQKCLQALSEGKSFKMPSCLAEYRNLQGVAKAPAVVEFALELLEQEIPIVIFGWHTAVISVLVEKLKKYNPVVITGATSSIEREAAILNFQEGKTNLFIGNIAAAGVGITLTRSSTVLMAEIDWSPANNSQAIARCHRITQQNQVTVYTFSVENSFDEDVEKIVMRKVREFNAVCDAGTCGVVA